jgi:ATP-dependent DNA helicase RecG
MAVNLQTELTYLKGVGEKRAALLKEYAGLETFRDLLFYFPFRYEDRSRFQTIDSIRPEDNAVQVRGKFRNLVVEGHGRNKRLRAELTDHTGAIEVIWFNGISWLQKLIKEGTIYIVYGKVNVFRNTISLSHPEAEPDTAGSSTGGKWQPVYSIPDKLRQRGISNKVILKLTQTLLERIGPEDIPEVIPTGVLSAFRLVSRYEAFMRIHHPGSEQELNDSQRRIKFEELFLDQMRLLLLRQERYVSHKGVVLESVENLFTDFYKHGLPFPLTGAQKNVLREIRQDVQSGNQMNRLLQGDVGSGKTIVALMGLLMAIDNGFQVCMMAPTEILARQHYASFTELLKDFPVRIALLTGNIKGRERKEVLNGISNGSIHILIGTHALIEKGVSFSNLGFVVIDEQHRFGVEQRSRLWKGNDKYPHVLVMTATPIPRTLSMSYYGDLDVSVIDELPPGRKAIDTMHYTEGKRLQLFGFIRKQIAEGRQVYIVYPLIEESEKLDLNNLMEGYRGLERDFPRPQFSIGMVHGRMTQEEKDFEMKRFVEGKSHILVSTTVIEVGVNVPNASVMVIENAERFGLAQLHQLRGRVGRGEYQSYCVLVTGNKLSDDGKTRIQTLLQTNDGFRIAEVDMLLRGPGEIEGTRQSGRPEFMLADLRKDGKILEAARSTAQQILEVDPSLSSPENRALKRYMDSWQKQLVNWSKVS